MLTGKLGLREILFSDQLKTDGSALELLRFFSLFGAPDGSFNIVSP